MDEEPVIVLRGNSLRIYLYLLKSREPVGIRDIWRALSLSSPSLVQYHIDRLMDMGLVVKSGDGYRAVRDGRVYPLSEAYLVMGKAVPRFTFYFSLILGALLYYVIINGFDPFTLAIGSVALLCIGIEMIRQWRMLRMFMRAASA